MANPAAALDVSPIARLARSIRRTKGFSLNFLQVSHPKNQQKYEADLKTRLADSDLVWIEINLELGVQTLKPILQERLADLSKGQRAVLTFRNMDQAFQDYQEGLSLLGWLNTNRDLQKILFPHVWLIWLPWEAITYFQFDAPDFWSWNRGVYVLHEEEADVRGGFFGRYGEIMADFLAVMLVPEEVAEQRCDFELAAVYRGLSSYEGWIIPRFWVMRQVAERLGFKETDVFDETRSFGREIDKVAPISNVEQVFVQVFVSALGEYLDKKEHEVSRMMNDREFKESVYLAAYYRALRKVIQTDRWPARPGVPPLEQLVSDEAEFCQQLEKLERFCIQQGIMRTIMNSSR